jgi:hypothetical protein
MLAALAAGVGTRILLAEGSEAAAAPSGTIILPDGALAEAAEVILALPHLRERKRA